MYQFMLYSIIINIIAPFSITSRSLVYVGRRAFFHIVPLSPEKNKIQLHLYASLRMETQPSVHRMETQADRSCASPASLRCEQRISAMPSTCDLFSRLYHQVGYDWRAESRGGCGFETKGVLNVD